MRIALAQLNPIVGHISANTQCILAAMDEAKKKSIDLLIFPELAISGYPPEDLLLLPDFKAAIEKALYEIIPLTKDLAVIVGLPRYEKSKRYNSAAVIENGTFLGFYDKYLLPTYDVFDERRYFEPGAKPGMWTIKGKKVAVTICEDIWQHAREEEDHDYSIDPIKELIPLKPDIVVNLSASPFYVGKLDKRIRFGTAVAKTLNASFYLCNQVGGNDSLIFDGRSFAINPQGELIDLFAGFQEEVREVKPQKNVSTLFPPEHDQLEALKLGLSDFCHKLGFSKVLLGLSGGIDSAIVAAIATEALGKENVLGIMMPSRFSSEESSTDAIALVKNLGMETLEVSIEPMFQAFLNALKPFFGDAPFDVTEENIQSRIRGVILMAFANKRNMLVLNTGNKSELALGYSTLYGDMCGAISVIGDLTKDEVYQLGRYINQKKIIIPESIFQKAPSAELRPNQKDTDSLPEYRIVDAFVEAYIEKSIPEELIVQNSSVPKEEIDALIKKVHRNEYKRRQAPPILKVSPKTFSAGRRFPIVEKWKP